MVVKFRKGIFGKSAEISGKSSGWWRYYLIARVFVWRLMLMALYNPGVFIPPHQDLK